MENKIGYAYISLEEYRNLIEANKELEYANEELGREINCLINEYESVENVICENVYNDNIYFIKNYDGIGEYYHNELVKTFQRHGYISLDKINALIDLFIKRYKKEGKTKDEK